MPFDLDYCRRHPLFASRDDELSVAERFAIEKRAGARDLLTRDFGTVSAVGNPAGLFGRLEEFGQIIENPTEVERRFGLLGIGIWDAWTNVINSADFQIEAIDSAPILMPLVEVEYNTVGIGDHTPNTVLLMNINDAIFHSNLADVLREKAGIAVFINTQPEYVFFFIRSLQ